MDSLWKYKNEIRSDKLKPDLSYHNGKCTSWKFRVARSWWSLWGPTNPAEYVSNVAAPTPPNSTRGQALSRFWRHNVPQDTEQSIKLPFLTWAQGETRLCSRSSYSTCCSSTQSLCSSRSSDAGSACAKWDAALSGWQACIGESWHRPLGNFSEILCVSPIDSQFPFEMQLLVHYWTL